MKSVVVGTYEPGTFLMRYYLKNFPYESALYIPFSVGDENANDIYSQAPGGEMTTERILAYIHECNHYIHDLSLSACIAEDYLKDEIAAFIKLASDNCSQIKYPILGTETIKYNQTTIPNKWLNDIAERLYLRDFLFVHSHSSSKSTKYSFLFDEHFLKQTEGNGLSYTELLEGYVHYKSANDLMGRAVLTGKYEYIRKFKDDYKIYPYTFNKEGGFIDMSGIYGKSNYTYHIARAIYMNYLSNFDWKSAFIYLESEWPKGYDNENNMWSILDCGFFLLLDIALTIPPVAYIPTLMKDSQYCIEDFSPVHRFLLALHIIRENQGFPDAKPGEPFYITLFNMIAKHPYVEWLDFENTIGCWEIFFNKIKKGTGDTSAGYRHRMFKHKFSKFHKFFLNIPSEILNQTATPLLSLVRGGGLKIIQQLGSHYMPYEGLFDAYDLYKMPFAEWKEYPDITDVTKSLKQEIEHRLSLMRESVYRMMSHNVSEALMYSSGFTCCFYNDEYFEAKQKGDGYNQKLSPHLFCRSMEKCKCCNVKDFQQLPANKCAVREYLTQANYKISQIKW